MAGKDALLSSLTASREKRTAALAVRPLCELTICGVLESLTQRNLICRSLSQGANPEMRPRKSQFSRKFEPTRLSSSNPGSELDGTCNQTPSQANGCLLAASCEKQTAALGRRGPLRRSPRLQVSINSRRSPNMFDDFCKNTCLLVSAGRAGRRTRGRVRARGRQGGASGCAARRPRPAITIRISHNIM